MLEMLFRRVARLVSMAAYYASPGPRRQTCKVCWRADKLDFTVPDRIWKVVVPRRLWKRVVCLPCFDDFAREAGVPYADHLRVLHFAGDQSCFELRTVSGVDLHD
jgi:hypothetical protein